MNKHFRTYIIDTAIITPLGITVQQNFEKIASKKSSIKNIYDTRFFPNPILASVLDEQMIQTFQNELNTSTRFDTLMLASANIVLHNHTIDFTKKDVLIILSTTKGNVELLATKEYDSKANLSFSAKLLQTFFKNQNDVVVVSNACISGVSASIVAERYLQSPQFNHVVIIGCDVVSKFVLTGFNSFKAIAKTACKPFDIHREGVVLGEASAAIIYSKAIHSNIEMLSGTISNDANHISAPSKTGEELSYCISNTLSTNNISPSQIDFISAHGTATNYNDEMEAKAIHHAGLKDTPLFSVKANIGHTLGASGVIELILASECLMQNIVLPSLGFEEIGVSTPIHVNKECLSKKLQYSLKTTSGFGGCNAALLLKKVQND